MLPNVQKNMDFCESTQRQTARENHPADITGEYYRRSLAIPSLDYLKEEIKKRFTSHSVMAIKCLGIIPSCFSSSERLMIIKC